MRSMPGPSRCVNVRAGEVCAGEVCAGQVCVAKVRIFEVRPGQVRIFQIRAGRYLRRDCFQTRVVASELVGSCGLPVCDDFWR